MQTAATVFLMLPLAHACTDGMQFPGFRYSRVGGIRFLRFGRLQLSFCVCRRSL